MARNGSELQVDRRKFLTGVAVAGTATAVAASQQAANAASGTALPSAAARPTPSAALPSAKLAAAETRLPPELPRASGPVGSDFMVDVIKSLDIEYIFANPASSFRGLHESLHQLRQEHAARIHQLHARRIVGRDGPRLFQGHRQAASWCSCHGTVGLQHATMAIYNAWCDRAPVIVMGGNDLDASKRPPGVPTTHSAQDINALVRDFTKWDDTPVSLAAFRAVVRARLQDRDDAAPRAGDARARRRAAGRADSRADGKPLRSRS